MKLLSDELDDATSHYQDAREEYLLKGVRRDDILDSMVLSVAARDSELSTVGRSLTRRATDLLSRLRCSRSED